MNGARRITRARRPRHVRGFLASSLGTVERVFISRVSSGVVGVLRRFAKSICHGEVTVGGSLE